MYGKTTMEVLLKNLSSKRAWGLAFAVAFLLGMLAFWVWQEQRRHSEVILERHTHDIAIQASRRLQVFMESHLRVASIFAERWSTHESADFTQNRFEQFASVVISELPGYSSIGIISSSTGSMWGIPQTHEIKKITQMDEWKHALNSIKKNENIYVSSPSKSKAGDNVFYALLPLIRGGQSLGALLVLFHSETLVYDCFHKRIRSEFHFVIETGGKTLFRSGPSFSTLRREDLSMQVQVPFHVRNQKWRLSMIPKAGLQSSWGDNAGVALLGMLLSTGMAALTFLLVRRIDMYRLARDKALLEIEQRRKAENGRDAAMERLVLLTRKAMAAQEEERARLSIEMHDELGQILTALRLNMELVEKQLHNTYKAPQNCLTKAITMAEKATEELRRLCRGLRPPLLDDLGLNPAIRLLIEEFQAHADIRVSLELPREEEREEPSSVVSLTAYRILQESLTNIRRHSSAQNASISLYCSNGMLKLTIIDDGEGFDISSIGAQQGCGLEGMRERANLANGHLTVLSKPGRGTQIIFEAPVKS